MTVVLQKGYTNKQYADLAVQANAEGKILTITSEGDVEMSVPVISLEEAKARKLAEINAWTKAKIVGGFVSNASGANVTYDSDEETQSTMQTMYVATKSPDFANHPDYQGVIPVRGFAEGSEVKAVFYLSAIQVQKFMDDLALHIGKCKQEGWPKQSLVEAATIIENIDAIIL